MNAHTSQAPTTESHARELLVAVDSVPELEKAVAKLARAARKLNLSPIPSLAVRWAEKSERARRHVSIDTAVRDSLSGAPLEHISAPHLIAVVPATVTLPEVMQAAGGWRLIGSIERTDEGTEAVAIREADIPSVSIYRVRDSLQCEHCRANRQRSKTLILADAAGTTKQVGRECAHNYLTDLSAALGVLEFQDLLVSIFDSEDDGSYDCREYGFGGARVLKAFAVDDALAHCLACIRAFKGFSPSYHTVDDWRGHEPRKVRNDNATWRLALEALQYVPVVLTADNWDKLTPEETYRLARAPLFAGRKPEAADLEQAAALLSWIGQIDATGNEFLAQLQDIGRSGFVSERRIALLAALPKAKARWDADHAPKPATEAPVGRMVVSGEVVSTKEQQSDFGTVWKWLVKLDDGNKVWSSIPSDIEGDTNPRAKVTFKATFKRSDKDPHFAFGSRPTGKIAAPKRARKSVKITEGGAS